MPTPMQAAAMLIAVVASVAFSVTFVVKNEQRLNTEIIVPTSGNPARPGVIARIVAGGKSIERELPHLDLALQSGEAVDTELAPGAFQAEFNVTFPPAGKRHAQIGAILQGGSLIIMRDDEVLLSDFAGADSKLVLTRLPVYLPRRIERLQYLFERKGDQPVRLQPMWKPEDAAEATPIPTR